MLSLNEEIDKNLQDKKKELLRLQRIRERHNNDIRQVNSRFINRKCKRKKEEEDSQNN